MLSIFGLPRIITCEKNLDRFLKIVDDPHNGITLCTGSLGCSAENDVVHMAAKIRRDGPHPFRSRPQRRRAGKTVLRSAHTTPHAAHSICMLF